MSPPTSAILAVLAPNIFLFIALFISTANLSHRFLATTFLPLIYLTNFHAWQNGLGFFAVVQSFWATELLLFRNPRKDFKLLHREKIPAETKDSDSPTSDGAWKEPHPESFWLRFWWVSKLVSSHRFIGWDTADNSRQVQLWRNEREQARGKWLLMRGLSAICCFLVVDATNSYQKLDPYFLDGLDIDAPLPHHLATFIGKSASYWFIPRSIRIFVFGLQQYCIFSLTGHMPGIVCVSLGGLGLVDDFWGNALNWPPLMGNPLIAFRSGLRGFWGKVWHQLFRNIFADPGRALATFLNIPPKSMIGYALQIAVAFFLSGALHAMTLPRDIPDTSPLTYAGFFWIHGICVLVEVIVEYMMMNLKLAESMWRRRCFGLVRIAWVIGALYLTAPMVNGELVKVAVRTGAQPGGLISFTRRVVSYAHARIIGN